MNEYLVPFLVGVCVNLVGAFLLGYVAGPLCRRDPLKVFAWAVLFSVVGGVVALMVLPEVEAPLKPEAEKRRLSKRKRKQLDEVARKMGM
jgi:uncharacterized membrane protein YeaQ/YmgE (transglycosylase-associated protein family)